MSSLERPKLRPVVPRRIEHQGQPFILLQDVTGALTEPVLIPFDGFNHIVRHFDGQSTISEIQARILRSTGLFLGLDELHALVRRLDAAMVIEGPTFDAFHRTYRESGRRPAALAGRSYAATVRALRAQLEQYFVDANGAGPPDGSTGQGHAAFRGVLSPHIDFQRGGPVYTWSYKQLLEQSNADTFVVLGVAHQYCRRRFALTFKDFETPLGIVPTDRSYVDRIASLAGRDLFDDELSHRTEHSIEFQVVFLQYVLGGRRDFSIVPILVGSFHDLMELAESTRSTIPTWPGSFKRCAPPSRQAAERLLISEASIYATWGQNSATRPRSIPVFRSKFANLMARCWIGPPPAMPPAGSGRPRASATVGAFAVLQPLIQCFRQSGRCKGACSITSRRSTTVGPAA